MTRSVVVTGAARGIGRAIALTAAARGWTVAVVDLDASGARAVADAALAAGAPAAVGIACDVTDESAVTAAFAQAAATVGPIDGAVANAGVEVNAPLHELSRESWDRVITTNLTGAFLTCKAAIRSLLSTRRPGSIVCMSSPAAFVGFAGGGNAAYGASKGGISAFVRSAALDYAAAGIRVNALVPGATDTPLLLAGVPTTEHERHKETIAAATREQIPLRRLADPNEIAAAAIWLLGDESSYVTGSNLVCDGGLLAKSANTI